MTLHKALYILFDNGIEVSLPQKVNCRIQGKNQIFSSKEIIELANCLESPEAQMISRFTELCKTCGNLKDATRLWNFADHQTDAEFYWSILSELCPWAFSNPENYNSLHFTYN